MSVFSLSSAILSRGEGTRMSKFNPMLVCKVDKAGVFTTHVSLEAFNFMFKLIFNKIFELNEGRKGIRLEF